MILLLVATALSSSRHRPNASLALWVLYLASFAPHLPSAPTSTRRRPDSDPCSYSSLPDANSRAPPASPSSALRLLPKLASASLRIVAGGGGTFASAVVVVSAYQAPPFRTGGRRRISTAESTTAELASSLAAAQQQQEGATRFICPRRGCGAGSVAGRSGSSRRRFGGFSSTSTPSPSMSSIPSSSLHSAQSNSHNSEDEEEEEWHPRDPAHTTPQLLAGIWHQISEASGMPKGETYSVLYPQMQADLNTPRYMQSLFHHLDVCKDVCDHFGISTTLVPLHDSKTKQVVGFTAKSFRDPQAGNGDDDGDGDMEFPYDPMWDDGTDYDTLYAGIDDEYQDADGKAGSKTPSSSSLPEIDNEVPSDDEAITEVTQRWVGKLMSDMGICPFTSGPNRAGLPLGDVLYTVDRSTTVEDMYARFWKEVIRIEQVKEKDLSTTLLVAPHFFLQNVEMFENFSNTLTQALTSLQVEDLVQLVFFHPHWSFRDGMDRSGAGSAAAANYARRSPWPMINLLRTSQVRAAQRGIPTGAVYSQNAKALGAVGVDKLESMLRLRDWSDIEEYKVNRRELDALRIAQDYQATGSVSPKDLSLEGDTTPAANKVDRRQVEQGDLVTVLLQAMDKRLGRGAASEEGRPPRPQALSGPETSASAMAADFLIQQLDAIAVSSSSSSSASAAAPDPSSTAAAVGDSETSPQEAARLARLEAARQALLADFAGDGGNDAGASDRGDEMTDVLFGKGGIPDAADDQFNKGLDPSSFY